jgi:hypothetical protein
MMEKKAPSAKFPRPEGWNDTLHQQAIQSLPEMWNMHYVHEWDGTTWLKIEPVRYADILQEIWRNMQHLEYCPCTTYSKVEITAHRDTQELLDWVRFLWEDHYEFRYFWHYDTTWLLIY